MSKLQLVEQQIECNEDYSRPHYILVDSTNRCLLDNWIIEDNGDLSKMKKELKSIGFEFTKLKKCNTVEIGE